MSENPIQELWQIEMQRVMWGYHHPWWVLGILVGLVALLYGWAFLASQRGHL